MIDIHTHLLPDFDDGPPSLDQTRSMIKTAEEGGTEALVVTPHILNPLDYDREEEIIEKFEMVKHVIHEEGSKLKAHLGGEIFLYPDTTFNYIFSTLDNNGKYALVEFGMRQIPEFVPQKLFDLLMEGYYPILAHPERYIPIMNNPKYAYKFAQMGVALQMNAGSILGVFGQAVNDISHKMIEHNLVHFIASDGHNTNSRSISMKKAWDHVKETFGEETATLLFKTNPERAIRGEKILKEEPIPFEDEDIEKSSYWQVLKRKLRLNRIFK